MTGNSCFFVDATFKTEVEQLRMQEYANASGFAVDLTTLKWKPADDQSYVMVANHNEQFVSTMRGEIIDEVSWLERKLECPWNFPLTLDMPVLLLSRAATCTSQRSTGMNLALRYWFLRFARHHGIRFVIGTFVTGSPREKSLRDMGYQFFENQLGWRQSTYRSLRSVAVVALDMETDGARALKYCVDRAPEAIEQFQFEGPFPEMKVVRCL